MLDIIINTIISAIVRVCVYGPFTFESFVLFCIASGILTVIGLVRFPGLSYVFYWCALALWINLTGNMEDEAEPGPAHKASKKTDRKVRNRFDQPLMGP